MKPFFKTLRSQLGLALIAFNLGSGAAIAQTTNTIFGYVGDYGLAPKSRVQVAVSLLEPTPRTVGNMAVRGDAVTTTTSADGYFAFHNLIWGKYRLAIDGRPGAGFDFNIPTNTQGSVSITSLIASTNLLPPNPNTNYYTQAQVDAVKAELQTAIQNHSTNYTLVSTNLDFRGGPYTNGFTIYAPTNATALPDTNALNAAIVALSYPPHYRKATNTSLFKIQKAAYSAAFNEVSSLTLPTGTAAMRCDVSDELALAGSGTSLYVISVTNRALPKLMATITTPTIAELEGTLIHSIAHESSFFYVGGDGYLQTYNCAVPAAPVLTSDIRYPLIPGEENSTTFSISKLGVQGGLLMVSGSDGVRLYSLMNPAAPVQLSALSGFGAAGDTVRKGNLLYIGGYSSKTIKVADISNPAAPVIVHSQAAADHGNNDVFEPQRLLVRENALYVLDDNTLQIFNLNHATNPVFSSALQLGENMADAALRDDILFWSSDAGTFIAYDICSPLSPIAAVTQANMPASDAFTLSVDADYVYFPEPNALHIYNTPKLPRFAADTSTLLVGITNSVRLPLASNNVGRVLSVKINANITNLLTTIDNDRIEQQATRIMTNGQAATFQSDGTTNWYRISP